MAPNATARRRRNPRRGIFSKMVFVLSGDLEDSHQKIEGWIVGQGGRVDRDVSIETTHLVCSMDDFKNKITCVKEAWKLGKAKCKIVGIKFITDCFITKKPKLVLAKAYLLEKILAGQRKKKSTRISQENESLPKSLGLKQEIEPPRHHIYVDRTGFAYKIVLKRTTPIANGKKQEEKLTIYLFESDPMPPTYRLAKKYKRAHLAAVLHHDESVGKGFQKAYAEFKSIFEEKTGISWDQRLDKLEQAKDSYSYTYTPPSGGKPVGVLPSRPLDGKKPRQEVEPEPDGSGTASDAMADRDAVDPDLVDDTDSGDDAD